MTFSPEVWSDALRRLQDEIPDFAFDAWIAPLSVKVADGRVALGCQNSFHRDRIRNHYAHTILDCWQAAQSNAGDGGGDGDGDGEKKLRTGSIELMTMKEFGAASGVQIEAHAALRAETKSRPSVRRVMARASSSSREATSPPQFAPTPKQGRSAIARTHSPAENAQARSHRTSERPRDPETEPGTLQVQLPFSFESFVVGPCNALAREAALALARGRQPSLNLLYLAGEAGMGKTHLARATASEARRHGQRTLHSRAFTEMAQQASGSRVVYTSAEQFTSEFVSAMRLGNSEQWNRRYRGPIGLLIVEDVQFFSGRTKTQLELFHTVQHVLDAGGSVMLTGDRAPRDLVGLEECMRDQVGRGFVAELERPDALVRRHLLRAKAAAGGVRLPADCLDLLVEASAGSVRDVESLLIQVVTTASLLGRTIDLALTREAIALKSGAGSSLVPKTLPIGEIVRIVATFFGKRPEALAGRSRRRDVLIPRQLAMYLAHRYTDASFKEIGRSLGRDHPAVRNAITRIERLVLENAPLRYQVEALSERLDQTLKRAEPTNEESTAPR